MRQPRHILVEVIAEKTLNIHDSKKLAAEVAAFLLEEGQVAELESILRDIIEYRAERGILEATVISAHELDARALDDARDLLKQNYPHAKTILISGRIDPEVVGGVRISLSHEQLDLTLRSRLSQFKRLTTAGKE